MNKPHAHLDMLMTHSPLSGAVSGKEPRAATRVARGPASRMAAQPRRRLRARGTADDEADVTPLNEHTAPRHPNAHTRPLPLPSSSTKHLPPPPPGCVDTSEAAAKTA
uniref:Uncharacterized protein n=1 Tax=Calcidiscus leptoporus TaxID=127549 RepID=A0A7S0NVZ8_9EUKA